MNPNIDSRISPPMGPAEPACLAQAARGLDTGTTVEQIIQHLRHDCRRRTHRGYSFSTTTPEGTLYVHAPCNQLRCRSCAKRFYHQVHPALCRAFQDHGLRFLVSLTLPGTTRLEDQELILKEGLKRLLHYAKRTFPGPLHYAWVLGVSRNRCLHVHMVTNLDLRHATRYGRRTRWLRDMWRTLARSFQSRVKEIRPGTEPNVVQYLLKNLFETVLRRGDVGRKYGCSRSIKFRPRSTRPGAGTTAWTRNRLPTAFFARRYGIDMDPLMNPEVFIPAPSGAEEPGRGEPSLRRRAATGGPTVPADGRAGPGAGVPVPPCTQTKGTAI